MKNNGGPAFPHETVVYDDPEDRAGGKYDGMSLRDYFAAKATEDDIRAVMSFGESFNDPCDRVAARFRHADAMIAKRDK